MPCRSSYPETVPYFDFQQIEQDRSNIKAELDKTTQLLCSTLRQIEHNEFNNTNDITETMLPHEFSKITGLTEWWIEHKKWDELRLIREENKRKELERQELIKSALNKLTDIEKTALGL